MGGHDVNYRVLENVGAKSGLEMRRVSNLLPGSRREVSHAAPDGQDGQPASHAETVHWLLNAGSAEEYQYRLDRFCSETLVPLVERKVSRLMRVSLAERLRGPEHPRESEALEVRAETLRRLINVLRAAWARQMAGAATPESTIRNLEAYVQKTVDTARADLVRSNAWRRFVHQVRRQVDLHPLLAIWRGADRRNLLGRDDWRIRGWQPVSLPPPEDFLSAHRSDLDVAGAGRVPTAAVILAVVDGARGPIIYDDVLSLLAVYYQIDEPHRAFLPDSEFGPDGTGPHHQPAQHTIEAAVIDNDTACRMWIAIQQMAPSWRQVLILGNDDLLAVLVAEGITSMSAAAKSVGLSERGLAELFTDIPLPDEEIARRLGIVVGAVRNQRWQARKALQKILDERHSRTPNP